jgi:hypothetical protein
MVFGLTLKPWAVLARRTGLEDRYRHGGAGRTLDRSVNYLTGG